MIIKSILRDQVKKHLQEQMLNGNISFGERISLPELAIELGVSITPIREALAQLEQINVVHAIPNRGFFLPKLNKKEAIEIYPIIASLEHLAIMESEYSKTHINQLEIIQSQIEKSNTPVRILKLDIEFHNVLLKGFKNDLLKSIITDLKIRVLQYEFHYMENQELAKKSSTYHQNIIKSLKQNNCERAADLVKESWLTSIGFIKDQFD